MYITKINRWQEERNKCILDLKNGNHELTKKNINKVDKKVIFSNKQDAFK